MQAAVKHDTSERTITIEIAHGPVMVRPRAWATRERPFKVDRAVIRVVDGETRNIRVSGNLVLKSGALSESQGDTIEWRRHSYTEDDRIGSAPGWVQELFNQAPIGIREYAWTAEELAEAPE